MADWRMMGSAMRRRMGAPSHHGGGAAALLRTNYDEPGRPEGTTKDDGFWDHARRQELEESLLPEGDEWSHRVSENHPSMRRRMKPETEYFG